eukprot:6934852-Prymnesium_polylepis.2
MASLHVAPRAGSTVRGMPCTLAGAHRGKFSRSSSMKRTEAKPRPSATAACRHNRASIAALPATRASFCASPPITRQKWWRRPTFESAGSISPYRPLERIAMVAPVACSACRKVRSRSSRSGPPNTSL